MSCKLGITIASCKILEGCNFARVCFEIHAVQIVFYLFIYLLDPQQVVSPGDKKLTKYKFII